MAELVLRQQRVPGNKGVHYRPNPPTVEEIVAVMRKAKRLPSPVVGASTRAIRHVLSPAVPNRASGANGRETASLRLAGLPPQPITASASISNT